MEKLHEPRQLSDEWEVTIPGQGIELEITPAFADQELITNRSTWVTYWEGAVAGSGFGREWSKVRIGVRVHCSSLLLGAVYSGGRWEVKTG